MPWRKNEDGEESSGKRSPWGKRTEGRGEGKDSEPRADGNGRRSPWGQPPGRVDDRPANRPSGTPDFDEFIRRSQERLRGMGQNPPGEGGGGGGPRLPRRPFLPWPLIAGGVALLFVASTAAFRVDAGEQAVVSRFGQWTRTVGPGFHLKFPLPVEEVRKVPFEDIQTTDIGATDRTTQNLMITGDQNLIDIAYTVRWRLKNAEQFLFQIADRELTVREVTESAMREMVARSSLNDAIGPGRAAIAEAVRERAQVILDGYGSGVVVQGIDIKQADPPAAVDEAFKDVSAAQQDAQQFLNQARAYAQQIQAQAQGAAAAFDRVFQEYRLAPEVTRRRMYYETMESVLARVDKTIVEDTSVQTYLPLTEIQRRARASSDEAEAQRQADAARAAQARAVENRAGETRAGARP